MQYYSEVHKARRGPQHSSRDTVNLIKFITFKNNVFVAITYYKYISVTSEKDEKLVDSNHGRVGARVLGEKLSFRDILSWYHILNE